MANKKENKYRRPRVHAPYQTSLFLHAGFGNTCSMGKGKDAGGTNCINGSITVVDLAVKMNIYLSLTHSPLNPDPSGFLQVESLSKETNIGIIFLSSWVPSRCLHHTEFPAMVAEPCFPERIHPINTEH